MIQSAGDLIDVLIQGAAQHDIEFLKAAADGEHRYAARSSGKVVASRVSSSAVPDLGSLPP